MDRSNGTQLTHNHSKSTIVYEPYFLIACKVRSNATTDKHTAKTKCGFQKGMEGQVEEWLIKKYEDQIVRIERQRKEDLNLVSLS